MNEPDIKLTAKHIRSTYPDCPQREMALGLMRSGNAELATAWLQKLDQLLQHGRSAQPGLDQKTG